MTTAKPQVAFFGLGIMGTPMAACVAKAGFPLTVVDAAPGKAEAFAKEHGCSAEEDAPQAAAGADVVVLILPTSTQVREVVDQIRPVLRPGVVVVDMTSGSPNVTREIAAELKPAGIALVDAPVSGGARRAVTGELAIMIGGEEADVAKVRPVLEAMGTALHVCGGVGAGQIVKAMNNLVYSAGALIAVEAMLIAQRAGVDPAVVVDVLNASTGGNGATRILIKDKILNRSFKPGFRLDLMLKDLTIAADLARETKTTAPYSLLCRETWAAAVNLLGAGHDNSAIAKYCERLTGDELSSPSVERVA